MTLTPEQLETFHREGFLLLRGFADASRCESILSAAHEEIGRREMPIETEGEYQGVDNATLRRLRQVYDRKQEFRDWMTDPDIRPMLAQALGETPVITLAHHNSIMTKMPSHSTETCWHQDRRYWSFDNDNLVSIWLALGDERMENGVLEFIPGSHLIDLDPDQFDARVCFRHDLEKNRPLIKKRVHFDLHPGDVVLFHCRTLHHAFSNQTDRPKIAFVYTVRGISNLPVEGTRSARHPEIILH